MCKLPVAGYTECPHVAYDLDVIRGRRSFGRATSNICSYVHSGQPVIWWLPERVPGKCHWCLPHRDQKLTASRLYALVVKMLIYVRCPLEWITSTAIWQEAPFHVLKGFNLCITLDCAQGMEIRVSSLRMHAVGEYT